MGIVLIDYVTKKLEGEKQGIWGVFKAVLVTHITSVSRAYKHNEGDNISGNKHDKDNGVDSTNAKLTQCVICFAAMTMELILMSVGCNDSNVP